MEHFTKTELEEALRALYQRLKSAKRFKKSKRLDPLSRPCSSTGLKRLKSQQR